MRRLIRRVAPLAAVVMAVAVALTVHSPAADGGGVRPAVLGATEVRGGAPADLLDSVGLALAPRTGVGTTPAPTTTTTTAPPSSVPPASGSPATPPSDVPTTVPTVVNAASAAITQAQTMVRFDYVDALRGWSIQFVGPRDGLRGATFPREHTIQVYVRPGEGAAEIAHTFAHELGHAVDVTYLDDQDRAEFNVARGRPAASGWWVAPAADDFASGAGDWAECFSWTVTDGAGGFFSKLGPPPSAATQSLIQQLAH